MQPKRWAVRKEHASSSPATHANLFRIRFWNVEQEAQYNILVERKIINTHYEDSQAPTTLGLYDDIAWMYEQIRWQWFMQIVQPTYIPLTLEFFSSVYVKVNNYNDRDSGEITFRLANIEHSLTLQQLN